MTFGEYISETAANAREYIEEQADYYTTWEDMEEGLFMADTVTGNGSGSFTFCTATAEDNAAALVWDDDFF